MTKNELIDKIIALRDEALSVWPTMTFDVDISWLEFDFDNYRKGCGPEACLFSGRRGDTKNEAD